MIVKRKIYYPKGDERFIYEDTANKLHYTQHHETKEWIVIFHDKYKVTYSKQLILYSKCLEYLERNDHLTTEVVKDIMETL